MNRLISHKFRFYSFICIALLLFVHGYNLNETYLQPYSPVQEPLTFTTFFEYFLANGILRFRIPLLFLISGYIYALQDNKPYGERTKKRFITLMIPYFIWSAVGLAITYLLQQLPATAQAVADAKIDQLGDNRPYEEIGWEGILTRWTLTPTSFQLWFIRVLFLYNVLYPIFRWLVIKFPIPWFIISFSLFFLVFNFSYMVEGQGLFFFTLGIWLKKTDFAIDRQPRWFSLPLAWLFFIGCSVIKTFMAFELEPYDMVSIWVMATLYASSIIAGIMAVWYGLDKAVKWFMSKRWFVWTSSFSFIIYGLHVPLVFYITRLFYMYFSHLSNYRLLTYLLAPLLTLLICIGVGALLRKLIPGVYKLATGGRGF